MNIDEAITHAHQVAEGCSAEDRQCAYQHDELADWLEELKAYRATGLTPEEIKDFIERWKKVAELRRVLPAMVCLLLLPVLPHEQAEPPPGPAPEPAPVVQAIPPPPPEPETESDIPPAGAHVIENCTVTWYTEDTCGKAPNHPAYGITASGLPVEEGVTCAVDPALIPLFSEVYVEYADGSIGRFQATDTGVAGTWVDIYTPDYDYAVQCGLQTLTVWFLPPGE